MLPEIQQLATVVVCEDDDPTRELLCDQLTADRYRALPAPSASDALRLCGYNHPDVMLLDLGLPDAPGIDVLREIRSAGDRFDPELPVLVLSGRVSEADRLRGFEAGADDYLAKPFHYPELLARVGAVLRRRNGARRGPIQIGDLSVDPVRRCVAVGEREVQLANKEFALLRALAAEPHRVFTKDELLRDVWGFLSKGKTRTLDSHASRLRRKLDPDGSRYVFNCWGVPQRHLFEPIPVPTSGDQAQ
jgi:DNA-binding response OmpR family regulator